MRPLLILLFSGLAIAQQKPPAIPADLIYEPDFEYSNIGGSMMLDIVRPRDMSSARPAILCIHGGGFRAGTRQGYLPLCIKLAQRGYVAATVEYRLSPRHQFPAPVHDVKAAVRYLRANAARFGIDPDRIGTTGQSAGGTLALFLGLTPGLPQFEGYGPNRDQSSRVRCVADFFGATDFTRSYGHSVDAAEVLPMYLGGDLDHERKAHIESSPLYWASPDAAPILALHGTKDRYVEHAQSLWLVDRLKAAGADIELETLEGADHGFKGADAERADARMFAYFDKHLKPAAAERVVLLSDHGPAGEIVAMNWPSGKVLWRVPNQRGHDVQALPDGHVLFTNGAAHRVIEIDSQHRVVWDYGAAEGLEHPISAQRLSNGDTVIGDAKAGKVIEVDHGGKVVWTYASPDLADMRMRNVQRTASGTTLIAVEAAGKIIEVNPKGDIVWTYTAEGGAKRLPYQAHRLANGNTRVSLSDPGEIVEVDPAGKVVRSIAGAKMDVCFGWVSGTATLPGGHLLVSDYTGRRIAELDDTGKVVNEMTTGAMTVASLAVVDGN